MGLWGLGLTGGLGPKDSPVNPGQPSDLSVTSSIRQAYFRLVDCPRISWFATSIDIQDYFILHRHNKCLCPPLLLIRPICEELNTPFRYAAMHTTMHMTMHTSRAAVRPLITCTGASSRCTLSPVPPTRTCNNKTAARPALRACFSSTSSQQQEAKNRVYPS